MESVTLTAPDISCDHCVATVQNAVGKVEGVQDVSAKADTKQVDVTFDNAQTTLDNITKALADAGYPAST
ncbi:MAG: heavy-metal-associated domain-containing protein [Chloroflexia bacterium]|jgi:copper ion binding protein|nr:heavy-metal-associated domain-containing protein [Chloroflexia bacterium]